MDSKGRGQGFSTDLDLAEEEESRGLKVAVLT